LITNEAGTTPIVTTKSFTEAGPGITSTPFPTTTSVPPPPVITEGNPVTTLGDRTAFLDDNYLGITGY
jgi:hypothetical protein